MTNWGVASLFGILGVLGCASTSDPGVSAAAGSGNAAPIPAQAAISFTVSKPASSGGACPVAGQTYDVGAPQAPSLTDPGNGLADGMQSAVVSCSVKGPAPFAFSGSIRATTSTGAPTTITVTFHDGQVLADGSGTVGISTYTPAASSILRQRHTLRADGDSRPSKTRLALGALFVFRHQLSTGRRVPARGHRRVRKLRRGLSAQLGLTPGRNAKYTAAKISAKATP